MMSPSDKTLAARPDADLYAGQIVRKEYCPLVTVYCHRTPRSATRIGVLAINDLRSTVDLSVKTRNTRDLPREMLCAFLEHLGTPVYPGCRPGSAISNGTPSRVGFALKPPQMLKPGETVRILRPPKILAVGLRLQGSHCSRLV